MHYRQPLRSPLFPYTTLFRSTKHPGTGGLVSVGTVTAQLLYEIDAPRYANPDVVARFDTLHLEEVGPDRVRVSGARGERSEEHTSELQSRQYLVCRLLLEKKK